MAEQRLEIVPSRSVLEAAERHSEAVGHEIEGFLSEAQGFVPKLPAVLAFPASHAAWDDVIARMPELWRTVSLRHILCEMPVLSAARGDLPDPYVWRAASALAVFAHAYVYVEKLPAGELPESVMAPWAQVAQRLGRTGPYMSYNDLIVHNHRLVDPSGERTIDNMELLVPSVDNSEERRFYLAQLEILSRGTPLVGAVVRAQEAAVRRDNQALEAELLLMLRTWRDIAELSFRKVDPNPLSATYVDQVVWANSVAPLAVPIASGTPGPGGEASPIFHLMDAFLGREFRESMLAKEMQFIRDSLPVRQFEFLRAVDRVSVKDYVAATGDSRLQALWDALFDAYAGRKGYLGIHRLKVYGFLELAFKVGRSVTITHIEGGFKERQWKTLDRILEDNRTERYKELPPHVQYAQLRGREPASSRGDVKRIVLDASRTGVVYRPGDRCGVLTVNRPESVERTLAVLGASGDEPVALNARWRHAIRYRSEHPRGTRTLPLRLFLTYAKLRPLSRRMAKALMAVSASRGLHEVVEGHLESQWELADALTLMRRERYDTARLVQAGIEQREALARIVPPEDFRMYSVASAPDGEISNELELTVAQLRYPGGGGELLGTASTYLNKTADGEMVPIQAVRPSRFSLPRDSSQPVVMFAGGVGIAPFRGFVAERRRDAAAGENWLFYATRTQSELYCEEELRAAVDAGVLAMRVFFSRENGRRHIDEALAADSESQAVLWRLLQDGAYFYVCGRAGFAQSVMVALTGVAARFLGDSEQAKVAIRRLMADGRYMQDVFTSWTPHAGPGVLGGEVYDASEVALHTLDAAAQWLTIGGEVYDMTEFLHLHPGGPRIVVENLGLDATREYEAVLHHENSEIDAMLAMYKIGSIRRLDFGEAWGIALVPKVGLSVVSLHDLYRSWVRFMHLLTEMGNALENDWGYLDRLVTRSDRDPNELNALKVQFASNTHQRFLLNYYDAALGQDILNLWALTRGLCAPPDFARSLHAAITAAQDTPEAAVIRRFSEEFKTFYKQVDGDYDAVSRSMWASLRELIGLVERQDKRFLAEVRELIRQGVIVFEQLEARTNTDGGARLIETLDAVPGVVGNWHREFVTGLDQVGWLPSAVR